MFGGVAEMTVYRPLYRKGELSQVLLTIGLVFVAIAALALVFGVNYKTVKIRRFSKIRSVSASGSIRRIGCSDRGRAGDARSCFALDRPHAVRRQLRADSGQSAHGAAVGINVNRLFTVTSSAAARSPASARHRRRHAAARAFYPLRYLVLFLIVVIVGGEGGQGSFVATARSASSIRPASFIIPEVASFLLYSVVLALLLWQPHGLLPAEVRGMSEQPVTALGDREAPRLRLDRAPDSVGDGAHLYYFAGCASLGTGALIDPVRDVARHRAVCGHR
jgi:branched-chain amino acid transport system permease protein